MPQTRLLPQLKQKVGEASPPPASCSGNIERQMFDGFIPLDKAKHNGLWLSLVERSVRDREVAGSNPVNPTIFPDNQWISTVFYREIGVLAVKVVKNAFSWNIQKRMYSMQIIYQHKLSVNFDWNFYEKAQLGKCKCQNAELENLSPTKRVFYPNQTPLSAISISWLVSLHIRDCLYVFG